MTAVPPPPEAVGVSFVGFATVMTVSPVLGEGTDFRRSRGDSGSYVRILESSSRGAVVVVQHPAESTTRIDGFTRTVWNSERDDRTIPDSLMIAL